MEWTKDELGCETFEYSKRTVSGCRTANSKVSSMTMSRSDGEISARSVLAIVVFPEPVAPAKRIFM